MKYFSLFSGIGGFELGIQQAYEDNKSGESAQQAVGVNIQSTRNITHNKQNHVGSRSPTCIGYSEVDKYAIQIYEKHFNHKNYGDITKINASTLPNFELLVGGFPCQAFSIAGKRGGFNDTRGTLFFDVAKILKEKQPRLCLLENVKGLLSHEQGATFRTIISTLDELGYDCQWQVLNSKNFGVPQNRERVFIIGHLRGTSRPEVFPFGEEPEEDTRRVGEEVAYCLDANYAKGTNTTEKSRRQIVQLKRIGKLNVYNTDAQAGKIYDPRGVSPTVSGQRVNSQGWIRQLNNPKHSNDRIYGADGLSPTLNTAQGGNRQPFIRRDGMEVEMDTANSVTPDAYLTSGKRKRVDGKAVLTSMCDRRIRRLTPTECERLQGFPDGWTEGVSDTQRYKTLGNAVTVNVIKEIARKVTNE
jgi:DNA (cytosine-5)-methyltransferase 1